MDDPLRQLIQDLIDTNYANWATTNNRDSQQDLIEMDLTDVLDCMADTGGVKLLGGLIL